MNDVPQEPNPNVKVQISNVDEGLILNTIDRIPRLIVGFWYLIFLPKPP
jgi:hypothetical protein